MHFEYVTYQGRGVERALSPYHYTPLNSSDNEIRLLELNLPHARSNGITARLVHYTLRDPPVFVALSYEWGNPGNYCCMLLDGVEVPITVNLAVALHHLLQRRYTRVWVDALCIDQRNEEERSSQILRMAAVYQKAYTVAAWLGPEADGSSKVMRCIKSFRRREAGQPSYKGETDFSTLTPILGELQAFFRRSYWNRVWIIQEIVAASNLEVLCGHEIVDWDRFSIFLCALPHNSRWLIDPKMSKMISQLRTDKVDGASVSMLQALHMSSLSESTDPKDKVFALLGLSFDKMVYVAEPTYSWTQRELCVRMTTSFIRSKNSLDIIFMGPKSSRSSLALPSWCPDYTRFPSKPGLRNLVSYISGQDQKYRIGVKGRRWRTTGLSAPSFSFTSTHLTVSALPVGRIAALGRIGGEDAHRYDKSLNHMKLKPGNGQTTTSEALCRVLFLLYSEDYQRHVQEVRDPTAARRDENGRYVSEPRRFLSLLYAFDSKKHAHERLSHQFEHIKDWRLLNIGFLVNGKTLASRCTRTDAERAHAYGLDRPLTGLLELRLREGASLLGKVFYLSDPKPTPDFVGCLSALSSIVDEGLRLMSTHKGDVGWAHPNANIRDEVFLIPGCSMPTILRPIPQQHGVYRIVGHAYVDGFMDGKAWSEAEPQEMVNIAIA